MQQRLWVITRCHYNTFVFFFVGLLSGFCVGVGGLFVYCIRVHYNCDCLLRISKSKTGDNAHSVSSDVTSEELRRKFRLRI